MLVRRGRGRQSGSSLLLANGHVSPPDDDGGGGDDEQRVPRRILPPVPTYLEGEAHRFSRGTGPVLARDKLYDRMCDWRYHTLEEFDEWMPEREWVRAVLDLMQRGFTFDRQGRTLRMRRLNFSERRPSIVDLLSGVTVPDHVGSGAGTDEEHEAPSRGGETEEASPFVEEPDTTPEEERLKLDESGSTYLKIGDFVTGTHTILARRGMGKTYLAMVLAESLLESTIEAPFVVVDPTGCWSGLLATADGQPGSHEVALFGGEHGHYPLSPGDGRLVARMVVELATMSCVLDLSLMRLEEQHAFVADFAGELYHSNRKARHVFFDEADIFAPQRVDKSSKHHGRCLAAVDNLTRRGRFRGLGETLVSQRPALVNKNLLSQVGSMFILHMIAPHDLNAVDDWLHDNIGEETRRQCRTDLPILPRGTAYYLRGGEGSTFKRFKVRAKSTFDSSRTPELGEEREVPVLSKLSPELDAKVRSYFQVDQEEASPAAEVKTVAEPAPEPEVVRPLEPEATCAPDAGSEDDDELSGEEYVEHFDERCPEDDDDEG